jgi:hypothetical protein
MCHDGINLSPPRCAQSSISQGVGMNPFTESCVVVVPFGKHKGKTIARIGSNDEGLIYLDWLIGQPWLKEPLKSHLRRYLTHPSIARTLDVAIEEDKWNPEESES